MEVLIFWLGGSALIGWWAGKRGRSGLGWFFIALLISPLLAGLILLVIDNKRRRPCPQCAEPILREAKVCPHCQSKVQEHDFKQFMGAVKGMKQKPRGPEGEPTGPRPRSRWQSMTGYEKAAIVTLTLLVGVWLLTEGMSDHHQPAKRPGSPPVAAWGDPIREKCERFSDAKARSGGSKQLSFASCMQGDGDPADAWIERTGGQ